MTIDTKITDDLDEDVTGVLKIREHLAKLYYDPQFSTIFNRPVLSMLLNGCDYLTQNITLLKDKYIAARG